MARKQKRKTKAQTKSTIDYGKLAISLAIPLLAGLLGSFATMPSLSSWYLLLNKPSWNPPNWLFGPVWLLLYIMMGVALYLVWQAYSNNGSPQKLRKDARIGLYVFGIQIVLNTLWSVAFFGFHTPLLGLAVIVPLWLAILLNVTRFWVVDRRASYLLVPYLAWVSFAMYLNYFIWILNP